MLVIEVELLSGRYAATAHDNRHRAEWPPHPARLFSALVAALHEQGSSDDARRDALLWLEQQPAPTLEVDIEDDGRVGRRDVHDVYVPVNDTSVVPDLYTLADAVDEAQALLVQAQAGSGGGAGSRAVAAAQKDLVKARNKLAASIAGKGDRASKLALDTANALMPAHRTRQVRTFPVYVPAHPVLAFAWPAAPPLLERQALTDLCAQVTRLGHSSSLVRCSVVDKTFTPTLVPADSGQWVLRVVGPGQLARLEREFERHQGHESRVLPARPQRYDRPRTETSSTGAAVSVFSDEWIVFQRSHGARLRSSRGTDLARALRAAVLEANGDAGPLPAALSGHRGDGAPGDSPHLSFIACPDVGHPHADGAVLGCAIVLPRMLSAQDRRRLMKLVARWERDRAEDGLVELGGATIPPVKLQRVVVSERRALQPARWCRPSRHFISATPIALDRNPGNLSSHQSATAHRASVEAQNCIADACERIGLPRPVQVEVSLAPLLEGAQPAREFGPWPPKPGALARAKVHARIEFAQDIHGPVLLGAGRHFGLGLCLPVRAEGATP